MSIYQQIFDSDRVKLYKKENVNKGENCYDCIKLQVGSDEIVHVSYFYVDMNEFLQSTLLEVLKSYHVTRFYDISIEEYADLESALSSLCNMS
ncbi:hypothetical protein [Lysinibacillus sp. 54212]|uniref:hypothetical protein n=1 Tax=Lysinibacillus sp. 54212 TaxID=3119829 RepID=UPI002FC7CB3D